MKKYILTALLPLLLIACQDENNPVDEQAPAAELISRSWRVQAVNVDDVEENAAAYSSYRFTFSQDQTYRFLMPDELTGTWELASNAQLLILDQGTEREQTVRVISLSSEALSLEFSVEDEKIGLSKILYELAP